MSTPHHVSLFDAGLFSKRRWPSGCSTASSTSAKLEAINAEAPKGMVQIARYFGTEFLRPELEKARDRMVNLVSLHLEYSSEGDLRVGGRTAARQLLFVALQGGSDMLKALIAMPQNSHFGMHEHGGFAEQHIPLLAKWSLRPLADYQAELAQRSQVADVVNAAIWMADALGVDTTALEEAGKDAEAVIRTALLAHACKRTELPDWATFEKMVAALRKKYGGKEAAPVPAGALPPPKNLPAEYRAAVEVVRQSVLGDLPRILDTSVTARKLFDQTPAFLGRYFWLEDALTEVEHFDRSVSAAWVKATSGHSDDGSLLTLFLVCGRQQHAQNGTNRKRRRHPDPQNSQKRLGQRAGGELHHHPRAAGTPARLSGPVEQFHRRIPAHTAQRHGLRTARRAGPAAPRVPYK
jgi:hypothetical protein